MARMASVFLPGRAFDATSTFSLDPIPREVPTRRPLRKTSHVSVASNSRKASSIAGNSRTRRKYPSPRFAVEISSTQMGSLWVFAFDAGGTLTVAPLEPFCRRSVCAVATIGNAANSKAIERYMRRMPQRDSRKFERSTMTIVLPYLET